MSVDIPPVAVLGAGLAGLTAAVHLKRHGIPVRVFEAGEAIAGLCKSEKDEEGYTFDCGVHFITNRLAAAVGIANECQPMTRYGETVHFKQRNHAYPLGLLSPKFVASAIAGRVKSLMGGPQASASDWYRCQYGRQLADEIALPLTEAWSGVPATEIASVVGKKFATSLPRILMLKAAAKMTKRVVAIGYAATIAESPNSWHVYPRGGLSAICQRMAEELNGRVETKSKVETVFVENEQVKAVLVNGERIAVSSVVSTAPVFALPQLVHGSDRLSYLSQFKYRAMVFVNIKLDGTSGLSDVVTWTPECDIPFFRLSDIGMGLPWLVPSGKSQLTCDIGCKLGDSTWTSADEILTEQCVSGLEKIVSGISKRVIGSRVVRVGLAYPVFHLDYEADRQRFEKGTGIEGLYSIGRNGEFAHILMEDVYWRTRWKISGLIKKLLA
ncbi:MAG: FAD-dependent oxidoreductase [Pirellulaceae bacterium]|nr:FAD-dependent oxidoreductase [Pirellulaceae bacterium]